MLREALENIEFDFASPEILVGVLAFVAVVFIGVSVLFLGSNVVEPYARDSSRPASPTDALPWPLESRVF
jgi:hypothetical protein